MHWRVALVAGVVLFGCTVAWMWNAAAAVVPVPATFVLEVKPTGGGSEPRREAITTDPARPAPPRKDASDLLAEGKVLFEPPWTPVLVDATGAHGEALGGGRVQPDGSFEVRPGRSAPPAGARLTLHVRDGKMKALKRVPDVETGARGLLIQLSGTPQLVIEASCEGVRCEEFRFCTEPDFGFTPREILERNCAQAVRGCGYTSLPPEPRWIRVYVFPSAGSGLGPAMQHVHVPRIDVTQHVVVELVRTAEVEVETVDETGAAVTGAEVLFFHYEQREWPEAPGTVASPEQTPFTFTFGTVAETPGAVRLPIGTKLLARARHPDYVDRSMEVVTAERLRVVLQRGASVRIDLTYGGRPLPEASQHLADREEAARLERLMSRLGVVIGTPHADARPTIRGDPNGWRSGAVSLADSGGRIDSIPPGPTAAHLFYRHGTRLRYSHVRFHSVDFVARSDALARVAVDLRDHRLVQVQGTAVVDGVPADGSLRLIGPVAGFTLRTDRGGHFSELVLAGVYTASFNVYHEGAAGRPGARSGSFSALGALDLRRDVDDWRPQFAPRDPITFELQAADGTPLAGLWCKVINTRSRHVHIHTTDARGTFRIERLSRADPLELRGFAGPSIDPDAWVIRRRLPAGSLLGRNAVVLREPTAATITERGR